MSRWHWFLAEMATRLWVRSTLYGVIAVATALAAIFLKRFIPENLSQQIGADAVDGILNIMAASMLSVTIFSLGAMVAAYSSATNSVTPRATKLLIEDKVSHNALSTFIGAFIFSIVGIIALKTGAYGDSGRLILFIVTTGVVVMVIFTLLKWIEYLARLGRVNETIKRVEQAASKALEERLRNPYLGGKCLSSANDIPSSSTPVYAHTVGYVQHIDVEHLSRIAEENDLTIYIQSVPGKFLDNNYPLAFVVGTKDEEILSALHKAFIIDDERSFRQDPRFGLAVLCEIATRSLSSAINDTGTSIYILGVGVRVLSMWAKRAELAPPGDDVLYPRLYVPALRIEDLFNDFFPAISRDSAGIIEVQIRLQKSYIALARTNDDNLRREAMRHSELSLKRAQIALPLQEDAAILNSLASQLTDDNVHLINNPPLHAIKS